MAPVSWRHYGQLMSRPNPGQRVQDKPPWAGLFTARGGRIQFAIPPPVQPRHFRAAPVDGEAAGEGGPVSGVQAKAEMLSDNAGGGRGEERLASLAQRQAEERRVLERLQRQQALIERCIAAEEAMRRAAEAVDSASRPAKLAPAAAPPCAPARAGEADSKRDGYAVAVDDEVEVDDDPLSDDDAVSAPLRQRGPGREADGAQGARGGPGSDSKTSEELPVADPAAGARGEVEKGGVEHGVGRRRGGWATRSMFWRAQPVAAAAAAALSAGAAAAADNSRAPGLGATRGLQGGGELKRRVGATLVPMPGQHGPVRLPAGLYWDRTHAPMPTAEAVVRAGYAPPSDVAAASRQRHTAVGSCYAALPAPAWTPSQLREFHGFLSRHYVQGRKMRLTYTLPALAWLLAPGPGQASGGKGQGEGEQQDREALPPSRTITLIVRALPEATTSGGVGAEAAAAAGPEAEVAAERGRTEAEAGAIVACVSATLTHVRFSNGCGDVAVDVASPSPSAPHIPVAEVNFLCVDGGLRSRGLAPALITEITRAVTATSPRHVHAVFTSARTHFPPLCAPRMYHRPIDVDRLLDAQVRT